MTTLVCFTVLHSEIEFKYLALVCGNAHANNIICKKKFTLKSSLFVLYVWRNEKCDVNLYFNKDNFSNYINLVNYFHHEVDQSQANNQILHEHSP